ncbi:A224L [African swine fever virus]|uniref:A224L n=1 Tax=African swine fever virus TaxID=10497 RepID=A0A2X0THP1_ASF|nr:hypothetical protein IM014_gp065 [African swine fever virus]QTZ19722.1 A224L [synthetic construct]AXZ95810.1 A224L [African swine fever virus]AXZ95998.1 A224L [African swine fever virus]AXZ96093.1 A224L [African swine fever virus]AYW34004.1 A224L [African swine fever virus]
MFPKINTIDPYISLRLFEVKPKYVGYSSIDARNQSFAIHDIKNYEKFSNAGLFYTSPTEITCYCCGMKFCNWLYEKHPLQVHAFWSRNCGFMRATLGIIGLKKMIDSYNDYYNNEVFVKHQNRVYTHKRLEDMGFSKPFMRFILANAFIPPYRKYIHKIILNERYFTFKFAAHLLSFHKVNLDNQTTYCMTCGIEPIKKDENFCNACKTLNYKHYKTLNFSVKL